MSKSMINRKAYQSLGAILLTFSISILMGQLSPLRAQETESEEFFNQGEQEFEREAEILEEPKKPDAKPPLTVDEEPPGEEVNSPEDSEAENQQPREAATEGMEERRGQQEQTLEQELNERNPNNPQVEYVPNPNEELELDDNEPSQPENQEVELKF
jgi:hypothetical protein